MKWDVYLKRGEWLEGVGGEFYGTSSGREVKIRELRGEGKRKRERGTLNMG